MQYNIENNTPHKFTCMSSKCKINIEVCLVKKNYLTERTFPSSQAAL